MWAVWKGLGTRMKNRTTWFCWTFLVLACPLLGQSPGEIGYKVITAPLSPYNQIGEPVTKKLPANEVQAIDLSSVEAEQVPLGALPRLDAPFYPRFFLSGEYLAWKINNSTINPIIFNVPQGLLEIAPNNLTLNQNGAVSSSVSIANLTSLLLQSQPTLSQNSVIDYGIQSGTRIGAGYTMEEDSGLGLTGNFLLIGKTSYGLSSITGRNSFPVLLETGFSNTINFLIPPVVVGEAATIQSEDFAVVLGRQIDNAVYASASNSAVGGELNLRGRDRYFGDMSLSPLAGFRYFQFKEDLGVNGQFHIFRPAGVTDDQVTTVDGVATTVPTLLDFPNPIDIVSQSNDLIKCYNHFIGPQFGFNMNFDFDRWQILSTAKIGIGVLHQVVKIDSSTTQIITNEVATKAGNSSPITRTTSTTNTTSPGGLLFNPVDVGSHSRNQFGFLPELNLKIGYRFRPQLKATIGYDFLLLSRALRAAEQTQLNPYTAQLNFNGNGQQQSFSQALQIPAFSYSTRDLVINGLNLGLQLDY